MSGKPQYKNPPATPINQWVREALEHAGLSQQLLADKLTRDGAGNFDRSIIQKMTVGRKVSAAEAQAISKITGYPLHSTSSDDSFPQGYYQLTDEGKAAVKALVQALLPKRGAD